MPSARWSSVAPIRNSQASKNGFVRMVLSPRDRGFFRAPYGGIQIRAARQHLDRLQPPAAREHTAHDGGLRIARATQFGDAALRARGRHRGETPARGLRIE